MLRKSPSRNQRAANGLKVKHVLQVFLLLAICTWVLYQVRHEKRGGENAVGDDEDERMKLGRKELWLRAETRNLEDGVREEEDEPGEEIEDMEVEGRGVGDDEIDGNDQETAAEDDDAADELEEDFGDKEERDVHPRDTNSATEKDQSDGEVSEDQVDRLLQDPRKWKVASDASSRSTT